MLTEPLWEVRVTWIFGFSGVPKRNQKPRLWPQKAWRVHLVPGASRGGRQNSSPSGSREHEPGRVTPSYRQGCLGPEYEGRPREQGRFCPRVALELLNSRHQERLRGHVFSAFQLSHASKMQHGLGRKLVLEREKETCVLVLGLQQTAE